MIYHIFFNLVNAKKSCSEMTLEWNLNCNKYTRFLITLMDEIWIYKKYFSEDVIKASNRHQIVIFIKRQKSTI